MAVQFERTWDALHLSYDQFVRTTDSSHLEAVQHIFRRIHENGYIYEGEYEGWYSVSEEIFYNEDELIDGKSPLGKEVEKVREKNYFFQCISSAARISSLIWPPWIMRPKFLVSI